MQVQCCVAIVIPTVFHPRLDILDPYPYPATWHLGPVPIPVPMVPIPMVPYPYPYPYLWSRTHTRTRTHDFVTCRTRTHGLVPVPVPIPMVSNPYPYPYPWPRTHTRTRTHDPYPHYKSDVIIPSDCFGEDYCWCALPGWKQTRRKGNMQKDIVYRAHKQTKNHKITTSLQVRHPSLTSLKNTKQKQKGKQNKTNTDTKITSTLAGTRLLDVHLIHKITGQDISDNHQHSAHGLGLSRFQRVKLLILFIPGVPKV